MSKNLMIASKVLSNSPSKETINLVFQGENRKQHRELWQPKTQATLILTESEAKCMISYVEKHYSQEVLERGQDKDETIQMFKDMHRILKSELNLGKN